jgi:hypothetical protein
MSIVLVDAVVFDIKPIDIQDGKAYKDTKGTIFIGCEILAVSPEQTLPAGVAHLRGLGDEVLPPLIVKAVSLDGAEFITEDQDIMVRAITIKVEQIQEGHLE